MWRAGSASLCTLGLRPHPASNQNSSLPSLLWETSDPVPVNSAIPRRTYRRADDIEPPIICMRLCSPDGTGNHVNKLDAHTHVGRREKQPFDEI